MSSSTMSLLASSSSRAAALKACTRSSPAPAARAAPVSSTSGRRCAVAAVEQEPCILEHVPGLGQTHGPFLTSLRVDLLVLQCRQLQDFAPSCPLQRSRVRNVVARCAAACFTMGRTRRVLAAIHMQQLGRHMGIRRVAAQEFWRCHGQAHAHYQDRQPDGRLCNENHDRRGRPAWRDAGHGAPLGLPAWVGLLGGYRFRTAIQVGSRGYLCRTIPRLFLPPTLPWRACVLSILLGSSQ